MNGYKKKKKVVEDLWKRNLEKGILCVVKLAMIRMDLFPFFFKLIFILFLNLT